MKQVISLLLSIDWCEENIPAKALRPLRWPKNGSVGRMHDMCPTVTKKQWPKIELNPQRKTVQRNGGGPERYGVPEWKPEQGAQRHQQVSLSPGVNISDNIRIFTPGHRSGPGGLHQLL